MMRSQSQRSVNGWTLAVAMAAALFQALLFSSCKKTPPTPGAKRTVARAADKGPPSEVFSAARSLIVDGDFAEAAEKMRSLNARKDVPPALQDWVLIYGGLAELLVNREEDARPLFAQLAERNASARETGKLAPFLYDLGQAMSGDKPVPDRAASRYDRGNHEALALYLFALKDESLGALDDAVTFYRQFATASAMGPDLWIGFNSQLKKLRDRATDICEYEELVDAATKSRAAATDSGVVERAVEAAKKVRHRIKQDGKLMASLDAQVGDKSKVMAEQDDADAEVFPAAKAKWAELAAKYEFGEAQRAIFEAKLKTDKRIKEQTVLANRAGYLDKFKFYLVLEARNDGYAKPVTLKSGATVADGIARLDDTFIYLRDKSGEKQVRWSEVAPESIYAMAKSLVTPDEDAAKASFRKWHLGNFAAFIGKADEARALLEEAMKANSQYEPEVAGILESASAP